MKYSVFLIWNNIISFKLCNTNNSWVTKHASWKLGTVSHTDDHGHFYLNIIHFRWKNNQENRSWWSVAKSPTKIVIDCGIIIIMIIIMKFFIYDQNISENDENKMAYPDTPVHYTVTAHSSTQHSHKLMTKMPTSCYYCRSIGRLLRLHKFEVGRSGNFLS